MSIPLDVLLVDDDPTSRFAMRTALDSAPELTVAEASNGNECLEYLRSHSVDLVLLDVVMPGQTGLDLVQLIKADEAMRSAYVILMSGLKIGGESQAQGLDNGADGYITRPISSRELIARVRAMGRIIAAERERDRAIEQLRDALDQVKTLRQLLPICMSCKKVRNDSGYWEQIEAYITEHTGTLFSHGLCPDCEREMEV